MLFAMVEGERVLELLHLLRVAALRAGLRARRCAGASSGVTGALLRTGGYRRRAVLVGTGAHIEAVAHALQGLGDRPGRLRLADAAPDERAARPRLARATSSATSTTIDEVLIADPDFPQEQAVELVDRCHRARRARARRAVDDGDPDGPGRVRARPDAAAVRAQAAGLRGHRLRRSSARSTSSARCCCCSCSRRSCWSSRSRSSSTSRGPVIYRSMRPGIGGEPFDVLQVPHDVRRTPSSGRTSSRSTTRRAAPIFKIRDDPRVTPVGRFLRRWSLDELPQLFNVLRGEMSLVGPRPLPAARLRAARGLAPQALPGAARA